MKYWKSLILRLLFVFIPISWIFTLFYYPTLYGTSIFFDSTIIANALIIKDYTFKFIQACIAPYAYYFILLLILFTKNLDFRTRINLLLTGWIMIFLMNIFRVIIIVYLTINHGWTMFDLVHLIWWKFLSGIYIALVWIFLVYTFKIKSIPIYDDIKYLIKQIKR